MKVCGDHADNVVAEDRKAIPRFTRVKQRARARADKAPVPRVSRTEYAILGLLAQGPTTGYDLKKLVEERLSHFWNESFGHLYPILARLHRRGWEEENQDSEGPAVTKRILTA